ncbi:biotin-independent malonate decarboxylase subunit gamma, partial [Acinetobacter baumannii]|uniref:biotin-independent malonate decarboxylase subunit gamma n=1 Tax=Acinetobacter baumannii TaxID=470 RepID=UPI001D16FB64
SSISLSKFWKVSGVKGIKILQKKSPLMRGLKGLVFKQDCFLCRYRFDSNGHQALAGAVDSYARARLAGHPIVSLLVGKSMSGAFLAHGYQANRIIALKDSGVMVHAMGKESAARVTLRSVDELEQLASSIPPMAYDIESYATLGLLSELLSVENPEQPTNDDLLLAKQAIAQAFKEINAEQSRGLEQRLHGQNRQMSKKVRELLREQWL